MIVSDLYRASHAFSATLPLFVLPDINGKQTESDKIFSGVAYTLFVFLSPSDCSPCLSEIGFWNQLASSQKRIHVCAIASHENKAELLRWIRNLDIDFPVLYDVGGLVTKEMGVLSTPYKVFADRRGRVLLKEGPSFDKPSQKAFLRRLNGIIGFPARP